METERDILYTSISIIEVFWLTLQASAAPVSPFDAIHKAASTLGSSLAWMGSYITEFVADVAGDDEPTDEEIAEAEKLK